MTGNPLALGTYCPTCDTRLNSGPDGATRPCPMCDPKETP